MRAYPINLTSGRLYGTLYSCPQATQHTSNLVSFVEQRLNLLMRCELQVPTHGQEILGLSEGPFCNVQKADIFLPALALRSLGNVRRYPKNCAPKLGRQSKAFVSRKRLGELINLKDKRMTALPDPQVSKPLHHNSNKSGFSGYSQR